VQFEKQHQFVVIFKWCSEWQERADHKKENFIYILNVTLWLTKTHLDRIYIQFLMSADQKKEEELK
jgi:hypothetical protein